MVSNSIRPQHSGLDVDAPPEACAVVIFGASGDLTQRELIPSLFELWTQKLMPERFYILGFARRDLGDDGFRAAMREAAVRFVGHDLAGFAEFAEHLGYIQGDFEDLAAYERLARRLEEVAASHGLPGNVLFHLATPPAYFEAIVRGLGYSGLGVEAHEGHGYRRIVIEKPFGTDRSSAILLDRAVASVFHEDQTYRIDHFLGKETVQNMLVVRFANPAFEPIWNRNYIDHVQITVAENIGIGSRAGFYEETGVVRDMVQNHILQLVCLAALEPPARFDGRLLRDETVKVLRAIRPVDVERDAVRGQYGEGFGPDGNRSYVDEPNVDQRSLTPTYAAMKLMIDNWRWQGVPFYLRTGKRLAQKTTEVTVEFKPTPHLMFETRGRAPAKNRLTFRLQPSEGILQTFVAKRPGPHITMDAVDMNFCYAEAFDVAKPPRAYAWLLRDVMEGDQTLFARSDWIEEAWRLMDPVIHRWDAVPASDFPNYPSGSWGPGQADLLLARDDRRWYTSLGDD